MLVQSTLSRISRVERPCHDSWEALAFSSSCRSLTCLRNSGLSASERCGSAGSSNGVDECSWSHLISGPTLPTPEKNLCSLSTRRGEGKRWGDTRSPAMTNLSGGLQIQNHVQRTPEPGVGENHLKTAVGLKGGYESVHHDGIRQRTPLVARCTRHMSRRACGHGVERQDGATVFLSGLFPVLPERCLLVVTR